MRFSIAWVVAGFLACLVCGCTPIDRAEGDPRGTIDLVSGAIDPRAVEPASSDATRTPDGSGQYLIVQLAGPATSAALTSLAANVDQIYGYLPQDSFLVRVAPGQPIGSLGAWAGVYMPEYKIARGLREAAEGAGDAAQGLLDSRALVSDDGGEGADDGGEGASLTVMVQAYPDADVAAIAAAIERIPEATVVGVGSGGRFSRLRLRVLADRAVAVAETLAALPEVFWIDVEGERALLNDTTIWVGQSGVSGGQATPVFDRGIHGEGQVIGIIDTGIDIDSCFHRDPQRPLPPQNLCDGGTLVDPVQRKVLAVDFLSATECAGGIAANEWDNAQGHGTHIAGTIAGDNFVRPIVHDTADGMAPGAKLVVQDAGSGADSCGQMPGIGCPIVDIKPFFQQAYAQGARLHSNSWGDHLNTLPHNRYTATSEDIDEFMWSHPDFLIFFAAGNSGSNPGTVFSPSTAKNAVSVGATLRGLSAESMAVFSGCGPTADGRIKPDITIPGSGILSSRGDGTITTNNCTTVTMSGTSMATPAAAGLAALVRQYFTDGFYPSGAATPSDGFAPSAALIKAALLNSARQMLGTNAGPFPGNCQGWGRVLLDAGLFFAGQTRRLFVADDPGFPQGGAGQQRSFTFIVRPNESLKATLVWTDFPSTPAASINLVNDLDLEVEGPSGAFRGNVFSGGVSQPGGAADRRNTVEQVLLAAPIPGVYTARVRAFNVPVGPQPFALVLSGDAVLNQPPVADAGPDQTGQPGVEVVLDGSASSDPDGVPSPLSFAWTQVAGPAVTLAGADTATARFTPSEIGAYEFRLLVSDGAEESEDFVTVTVSNQPPVADAGPDQTGFIGVAISLDGTGSNDPDGAPSPLSFAWTQTAGPEVTLAGADTARPSFTASALGTYTFRLVVSDGAVEADDTVSVTIVNQAPVASAGEDRTGFVGDEIVLDGSGSADPDDAPSPLTFAWTQVAGPPVTLAGANTALARFTPSALGIYTFQLVVSDGPAEDLDTVTVTIANQAPIPHAGDDATGFIGSPVQLDGSQSRDPDGVPSPLSFSWSQIAGPPVTLSGASAPVASFTPTALGPHTFRLVVSDGEAEAADTVTVTILNQAPIADAGDDQAGFIGPPIQLDGSRSRDPDGVPSPLSFTWTQIAGPPVTLAGADTALPSFVPSLLGTYTFRLVVSDGAAEAVDLVDVLLLNQAPVADAGPDMNSVVGLLVELDGSGSHDPDGLPSPLTYEWTQIAGPQVRLLGPDLPRARFIPALLGTYTFRLTVSDGAAQSSDTVSVSLINQRPSANAGADQTSRVGTQVLLDGTGSSDPDGVPSPLSFAWTQTGGATVAIAAPASAQASFTPSASGTYSFRLVVSDGLLEDDDDVTVTVTAASEVVFSDDFETNRGWTVNPSATDTAVTGRWERGQADATSNGGLPMQLAARSGTFDLATGAPAGESVGANDIDGGTTSIQSPAIALPSGQITLSFAFYLAHLSNSSTADFLRVRVVGATAQTVLQELGATNDDGAVWETVSADISGFAGQTVRILVEAADASGASLVEAAIDDLKIEATF